MLSRDPTQATGKADARILPAQQGRCGVWHAGTQDTITRATFLMARYYMLVMPTSITSCRTGRVARATLGTLSLTKSWAQTGGATRKSPMRPAPVSWYAAAWDARTSSDWQAVKVFRVTCSALLVGRVKFQLHLNGCLVWCRRMDWEASTATARLNTSASTSAAVRGL